MVNSCCPSIPSQSHWLLNSTWAPKTFTGFSNCSTGLELPGEPSRTYSIIQWSKSSVQNGGYLCHTDCSIFWNLALGESRYLKGKIFQFPKSGSTGKTGYYAPLDFIPLSCELIEQFNL